MNKFVKSQRGITLTTLTIAVIILIIITGILVYNAKDSAYVSELGRVYNDIGAIREKVATYYSQYGQPPIDKAMEVQLNDNRNNITDSEELKKITKADVGAADSGKFYVVDLKRLEGLTLNHGKDYYKITEENKNDVNSIEGMTGDLYIINEASQNVFYVKGIQVDNEIYYTDQDKDDVVISLKYVDGIRIPDGYKYVSGSKDGNDLKIKKADDSENYEYVWISQTENITTKPSGVNVQDENEFIKSVNENDGYFFYNNSTTNPNVIYIPLERNWVKANQKTSYTDKNGDTVYIPKGYSYNLSPNMCTVFNGFVIKDDDGNEYVWINVPKKITQNANNDNEIEQALKEYVGDYRKTGYEDSYYTGSGLSNETEYNNLKSKMLQSIKENCGFYIGRYETGKETSDGTAAKIKRDLYPYDNISITDANTKARGMISSNNSTDGTDENTTSLMFGIQWDLMNKFIETTGVKTKNSILSNSSNYGNYNDVALNITRTNAKYYNSGWNTITTVGYTKTTNSSILLSTGATERNSILNIFDLAGNVSEMTLEKYTNNSNNYTVYRGGNYTMTGNDRYLNSRTDNGNNSTEDPLVGFRVVLY